MSWIDVVKQRRAKLEAKRSAQAEREAERKTQNEARLTAEAERSRTREMNRFVRRVKPMLPAGVEIADVFWSNRNPVAPGPVVRVDLGNGVRLDLVLKHVYASSNYGTEKWPSYSYSDWYEVAIYTAGNADRIAFLGSCQLERRPLEEALYDALIASQGYQKT